MHYACNQFADIPCNCVIEIFRLTPFANAGQAKNVIAIGQYAEAMFAVLCLFGDHFEAYAARFIL